MPYCNSWEEFAKAAERLYISDPMKVRKQMDFISLIFYIIEFN